MQQPSQDKTTVRKNIELQNISNNKNTESQKTKKGFQKSQMVGKQNLQVQKMRQ